MSVNNQYQFVAAAWVIDQRITEACKRGNKLSGLGYEPEGNQRIEGEDQLPNIMPYTINYSEDIWAGGSKASAVPSQNTPVANTLTLVYRIRTSRKCGWFRRDAKATKKGLLEWLALIQDVIETDITTDGGNADATLNASAAKPISFSIQESETSELSYTVFLEIEIMLQPTCRGERSFDLPVRT